MTILVIPNLKCNLMCTYCFGSGYKWASNLHKYDINKIIKSMKTVVKFRTDREIVIHGGEPLLTPINDLEKIFKEIRSLGREPSIQTNGMLITDEHIDIFKKYNVHVGISWDGRGELNKLRGFPNNEKLNEKYNKKLEENVLKLVDNDINVGIITVLSKVNAGDIDKLEKLWEFILWLKNHGITGGRLNPMWTNNPLIKKYELTPEELANAWLFLYERVIRDKDLMWQPFREMIDTLLGYDPPICVFNRCDYWNTQTVVVILGDGSIGNCDRTHQEQITYTRANATENNPIGYPTFERYYMLKQTDCKGCRYFNVCGGGCPANGINGDWRRKTRWCYAYKKLWERIENDLRGMFPNIFLVTDLPDDVDYYEMRRKGEYINPFWRMTWESSDYPSSWRGSWKPIKNKIVKVRGKDVERHADFTNHIDTR